MKIIIKLMLILALSVSVSYAKDMDATQIINKMITVYGGKEKLKQLNDYKQVWHIETKVSDTNGTDSREVMMPAYLYTHLLYPHKSEIRILDNNQGIKKYGERTIVAQGPMLDAMKLQLMRLFSPLELQKRIQNIQVSSTPTHYVLSLSEDSVASSYFVSKKSFFIEKVIGKLHMGRQKMEFLTLYEDYRSVNGVMMPHREVKFAGEVNTAIMRLKITKFKHIYEASNFIKLNII